MDIRPLPSDTLGGMTGTTRVGVALALGMSLWSASGVALAADDKAACTAAADKAQELRDAKKLRSAREQALQCARAECPAVIRADCATWLTEIEREMPSVVFRAHDNGQDLLNVRVFVDGQKAVDSLDGKAVPIDPGPHTFRFEADGKTPVEQQVLVGQGEKSRGVVAEWGTRPGALTAAPAGETTSSRPVPATVWIAGGVGVAGLAVFGIFDALAWSKFDDLKNTCDKTPAGCSDDDKAPVKTNVTIAAVGLGVGAVGLVTAGVLYFTRPTVEERVGAKRSTLPDLAVQPLPGGGYAGLSGRF